MVLPTPTTSFRKNRRRERPGARKRHALSRKLDLHADFNEGALLAHDASLFPFDGHITAEHHPSLEQSWLAWLAHEDEKARASSQREEEEQRRLFGGDADDDVSLCAHMLGVVYALWGDIDYTDP
jgi:hypothetical protein